jgi:ribose transport system ATP-binding protein
MSKQPDVLVRMAGITKRYPGVVALDDVSFELRAGEIHMVLGENGAGKSTLIRVLSGATAPDKGTIEVDGTEIQPGNPAIPIEHGVRAIYQELSLCPDLDIARNLYLGCEPLGPLGTIRESVLYKNAAKHLEEIGIKLDPHRSVRSLSVTQAKMVEIARSLVSETKVLILDEPTDVLEDAARAELFDLISRLRSSRRIGFVYISHRYGEVHSLGDRVTILRDGRYQGTHFISDMTLEEMIDRMVGSATRAYEPDLPTPGSTVRLSVSRFDVPPLVSDVSFELKDGEIIAFTGLMGAGKTELARGLAGVDASAGDVRLDGKEVNLATPRDAIRAGISFLTEDRKQQGLVLDHSIADNYGLPNGSRLSSFGLMNHRQKNRETAEQVQLLNIKTPTLDVAARTLSGGNQQKIVLAKWLGLNTKVILFDEPTRGIDINGRRDFYNVITGLARNGTSVIVFTSDYGEAIHLANRIFVLHEGTIAASFVNDGTINEATLLNIAAGSTTGPVGTDSERTL